MAQKRKKLGLGKIAKILCVGAILTAYGYGAGRAKTSNIGLKHWNPLEIYRVWEARKFEKNLATQIYGCKSFGRHRFHSSFGESLYRARLHNLIYSEDGLAEFNGIEGIQAEEYVKAIKKIYDKNVTITQRDIRDPIGRNILSRLIHNTPTKQLEKAIRNWNSGKPEKD